jgi:hypothetical protein
MSVTAVPSVAIAPPTAGPAIAAARFAEDARDAEGTYSQHDEPVVYQKLQHADCFLHDLISCAASLIRKYGCGVARYTVSVGRRRAFDLRARGRQE